MWTIKDVTRWYISEFVCIFSFFSFEFTRLTLFLFCFVCCLASDAPFLKLRRWNKTSRAANCIVPCLPPMMIVFADNLQEKINQQQKTWNLLVTTLWIFAFTIDLSHLQNFTSSEWNAGLCARYKLVIQWVVVELCTNINLMWKGNEWNLMKETGFE